MLERILDKIPQVRAKNEAIASLLLLLQAERAKNKELQATLDQLGVLFAPDHGEPN